MVLLARAESDPRFLGRAESVLGPWWSATNAPGDVLLLRATIEQSRHDFNGCLTTLNRLLRIEPRSSAGWLTKATVLTVLGEYSEARRACIQVARLTDALTALTAAASITSMTGGAVQSFEALDRQLSYGASTTNEQTLVWAHTVCAEIAERLGRVFDAESHFRQALSIAPADPYTLGAFSDFLLSQNRFGEVVELLKGFTRNDGLLLRLAEACKAGRTVQDRNESTKWTDILAGRIALSRARGSQLHLREESRFELHLRDDANTALRLALANWGCQREVADFRLLLESARAAGDTDQEALALEWARTNRFEDVHLIESKHPGDAKFNASVPSLKVPSISR